MQSSEHHVPSACSLLSCFRRPNDLMYPNLHNSLGPNVGSIEQDSEEWADAHVCTRTRVDKTLSSRRQVR